MAMNNPRLYKAYSPIDGHLIDEYQSSSELEVKSKILAAREAAELWGSRDIKDRLEFILRLKNYILAEADSICLRLVEITGKVKTEALIGEIYPLLDMMEFYVKHAKKILAKQQVYTSPLAYADATAYYQYHPYGVVAIISPWNYPFQLTLYPLISALIAGNSVIFKPSENTLPVGQLIMQLIIDVGFPNNVVQCLSGGAEVGEYLIDQRPDLVFFTGGRETGRKVMAKAAAHPIPVMLELGGKDAMVVYSNAVMERAVNAAMYGAFSNSGQVCISVERLYVEQGIFEKFIIALCTAVAKLKVGHDAEGDLGTMMSSAQVERIQILYEDAVNKGAEVSGSFNIQGCYVSPVIMWNLNNEMTLMQEEIFGPLLPVIPFSDSSELIEEINRSRYGLNASIWSTNIDFAQTIAGQLKVGGWAINDVIKNAGHPQLPFGGVKSSGFGRYHGAEGLRSFTYTVSTMISQNQYSKEPNWFPYSDVNYQNLLAYMTVLFGSGSFVSRLLRYWKQLIPFKEFARLNLRQHGYNLIISLFKKHF